MPGVLTSQQSADSRSGYTADIFAPAPRLPTSGPTGRQLTDSGANGIRKRFRHHGGFDVASSSHALNPGGGWADNSLTSSRLSATRSPPPLANDRYELAGGMERPDMFSRHHGDYDDYFQLETQRGMWSSPTSPPSGIAPHLLPVDTISPAPNRTKPWVLNQILSIVGGVAGKLVQFCAVPFRGFQAGGGQAYAYNSQGRITKAQMHKDHDLFVDASTGPTQKAVPGKYVEDSYGVFSIESLENERPRVSKRLRTGESWVVVDQDGEMQSRPCTPRLSERRLPNHARSPSQIPRPVSRAGSTNATPQRPSLIPVSRRSTLERKPYHGASKATAKPYSTPRSYSRQSYGSPVMFQDTNKKNSPLPPESQRLINKMRREELEEDARMHRMSSQMSAMLREAQEALGSKFEVNDDYCNDKMDDEGYSETLSWYER